MESGLPRHRRAPPRVRRPPIRVEGRAGGIQARRSEQPPGNGSGAKSQGVRLPSCRHPRSFVPGDSGDAWESVLAKRSAAERSNTLERLVSEANALFLPPRPHPRPFALGDSDEAWESPSSERRGAPVVAAVEAFPQSGRRPDSRPSPYRFPEHDWNKESLSVTTQVPEA